MEHSEPRLLAPGEVPAFPDRPAGDDDRTEATGERAGDVGIGEGVEPELDQVRNAGRLVAPPVRVFPLAEAATAFRFMAQARHIGKIVVRHEGARSPVALRPDPPTW